MFNDKKIYWPSKLKIIFSISFYKKLNKFSIEEKSEKKELKISQHMKFMVNMNFHLYRQGIGCGDKFCWGCQKIKKLYLLES